MRQLLTGESGHTEQRPKDGLGGSVPGPWPEDGARPGASKQGIGADIKVRCPWDRQHECTKEARNVASHLCGLREPAQVATVITAPQGGAGQLAGQHLAGTRLSKEASWDLALQLGEATPGGCSKVAQGPTGMAGTTGWDFRGSVGAGWGVCFFLSGHTGTVLSGAQQGHSRGQKGGPEEPPQEQTTYSGEQERGAEGGCIP